MISLTYRQIDDLLEAAEKRLRQLLHPGEDQRDAQNLLYLISDLRQGSRSGISSCIEPFLDLNHMLNLFKITRLELKDDALMDQYSTVHWIAEKERSLNHVQFEIQGRVQLGNLQEFAGLMEQFVNIDHLEIFGSILWDDLGELSMIPCRQLTMQSVDDVRTIFSLLNHGGRYEKLVINNFQECPLYLTNPDFQFSRSLSCDGKCLKHLLRGIIKNTNLKVFFVLFGSC